MVQNITYIEFLGYRDCYTMKMKLFYLDLNSVHTFYQTNQYFGFFTDPMLTSDCLTDVSLSENQIYAIYIRKKEFYCQNLPSKKKVTALRDPNFCEMYHKCVALILK